MLENRSHVIQCCRAGAIGDVMMTTPAVAQLRIENPDAHIRYVTHRPELLLNNPDIDALSMIRGNCDQEILFEYPMADGYPAKPLTKHLAQSFADCAGVKIHGEAGKILFTDHELSYGRSIREKFTIPAAAIHLKSGWSAYKDWSVENWQRVVDHFFGRLVFFQIGGKGEPKLEKTLPLAGELSIRMTAALIAACDMLVGIDSFPNHVAGALKKPAVIIFGSTSPIGSGYASAENLWANLECSPCYREYNSIAIHKQDTCPNEIICQKKIEIGQVIAAIENQLTKITEG